MTIKKVISQLFFWVVAMSEEWVPLICLGNQVLEGPNE